MTDNSTLQGDFDWIIKVMKMVHDRVLDGECVTLYRPTWLNRSADIKSLMEEGMIRQIRKILSTAEVVDQEF